MVGGGVGKKSDFKFQVKQMFEEFLPFFKSFDSPVIFIEGNHGLFLDKTKTGKWWKYKKMDVLQMLEDAIKGSNVHYLNRSSVNINGVNFFGSPYVPSIEWDGKQSPWAFQYPQFMGKEFADNLYNSIPDNTDVLITHCPPEGILNRSPKKDYGCPSLTRYLSHKSKAKVHVFGHSHSRGTNFEYPIKFVNAAISGRGKDILDDPTPDGNPYIIQSLDPIIVEV
jgi:Icc-related predicted phosphoesterase